MKEALALYRERKWNEAGRLCKTALEAKPDDFDALSMLGMVAVRLRRPDEAVKLFERAAAVRPRATLTHYRLAGVQSRLSRFEDAVASYDRVIALEHAHAGARRGRRIALRKLAESLRVHARALEDTGARGKLERKLEFLRLAGEKRAVVGESPPSALVVDYRVPRPDQDSGSVRMVALMRLLVSLGYRVTFLAQSAELPAAYAASLRQAGITVRGMPQVWGVPHELALRGTQYHLILISRYHVAERYVSEVRRFAPQATLVFDTVDLHYVRMRRRAELEQRASLLADAHLVKSRELAVVRDADMTLVVSEAERETLLHEVPTAIVSVVSNIHEVHECVEGFDDRRDLFFVGEFAHAPNVDAMRWYCAQIWPLIRKQLPDAVTHVIGSHVPESLKRLGGKGIRFAGHVPDLTPHLTGCRLSVAPLRYGAGVKGKINTAQSWGVPVVATSAAVEGMHLRDGHDVLVADDPAGFARAVARLYTNKTLWNALSAGAKANVQQRFSPEAAASGLSRLRELIEARRRNAPLPSSAKAATKSCLVLPPASYGSLGDEAMVRGLVAYLGKVTPGWSVDLLSTYRGIWPRLEGVRAVLNYGEFSQESIDWDLLAGYDEFLLFGADVLDGHYSRAESMDRLRMLARASEHGLRPTVLGFSVNDRPDERVMARLKRLSTRATLCVRDSASLRRLERIGVENLTLVADVAFLMPPAAQSAATRETEQWVAAQQASGRRVAIVCLSVQVQAKAEEAEPTFLETFGKELAELASGHGVSVLLLPHDLRLVGPQQRSDVHIAMELATVLGAQRTPDRHRIFIPEAADQVKRLAGKVDFVITGRMHVAIAALGMGTPAMCLTFQGKFAGLLEYFSLEKYLIDPGSFEAGVLRRTCIDMLANLEELSARVKARLPKVIDLARSNFHHLIAGARSADRS
jgi:polysaccharide pyruvyl transferase WcaK-like protein/glycosyltransferase involved in cell wall biosynthesis